ncbi:MAG: ABC transporter permease [Firmicutes bacterium]|nr:ABC transporter permease [Bacillota bacterium]MBR3212423.1 ABC transporter permease [Bacillota bacterium]
MKYIIKKTIILIVTLLLISALAFLAFQIIPGDPTTKILGTDYTPERAEALRHELGLDQNMFIRYGNWLKGFVTGDLGTSYSYFMPVKEVLKGKVSVTFALSCLSWIIVTLISVPLGIAMARYNTGRMDRFNVVGNQIFMAIPSFFLGIMFAYFFGLVLHWFVPGRFIPFDQSFIKAIGGLILPAFAISIPKAAKVAKLLRSSILNEMGNDYVRTAYSRGNSRWQVIRGHVLRNALLPAITYIAMSLADIVAGSIIVEQVFALPGLGKLLMASIGNRDYPVAQCIVVIIAFVVVFMNYLADVITQYVDPRVRLS